MEDQVKEKFPVETDIGIFRADSITTDDILTFLKNADVLLNRDNQDYWESIGNISILTSRIKVIYTFPRRRVDVTEEKEAKPKQQFSLKDMRKKIEDDEDGSFREV